jgi:tRNA pseudouridine synthase 10
MAKRKTGYFSSFSFEYSENKEKLIHNIFSSISQNMRYIEFNSFLIGLSVSGDLLEEERSNVRDSISEQISSKLYKRQDFGSPEAYFFVDFDKKQVFLRLKPVFVHGKYSKFSREIAQTQHFRHKTKESVEQLLAQSFLSKFEAQQLVFHGAGREDVDVLMLGKGREFVVEIRNPKKRKLNLEKIEKEINTKFKTKIAINSLTFCGKEKVSEVKDTLHSKKYSVIVSCSSPPDLTLLSINKEIKIKQRTPLRVSKRRADMIREKTIKILSAKKINENEFELVLETSHGAYVKEFISGDDGRTKPSISSFLGTNCVCKQLDVLEIL